MNIVEKYLNKVQNEVSSASGIACRMDSFPPTKSDIKKDLINFSEQNQIRKDRIMIDFDNTIHSYNGWQNGEINGDPLDYVKESIDALKNLFDVEIFIFTTRLSKENKDSRSDQIKKINEWLDKHGIQVDGITSDKLGALMYIDDKGFRIENNWKVILPQIIEILKSEREQNIK